MARQQVRVTIVSQRLGGAVIYVGKEKKQTETSKDGDQAHEEWLMELDRLTWKAKTGVI